MLSTTTESKIVNNYRNNSESLYAADAAIERALDDLLTVPDWNNILQGNVRSAFVDGSPSGTRTLPDGTSIDLTQATNVVNCGHVATCAIAEMNTSTEDRPWGANNPRWKLYAYGPLSQMIPTATINSNMHVAQREAVCADVHWWSGVRHYGRQQSHQRRQHTRDDHCQCACDGPVCCRSPSDLRNRDRHAALRRPRGVQQRCRSGGRANPFLA